ncbi:Hypothetical protein KLENKIAIHU_3687 [Klenkia terrae]|nr:Hypothetical protein KLENKIAIHU_3687 [Klenkia terrae]
MSFLVPLPADQPSRALLPPTDPSTGVVTFTARPTKHAWVIGQDLLAALGINHDVYGSGRRHGEDLEYARAWLTAHDVRLVIVRHADTIPSIEFLDDLEHLSSSVGADLVLTCDDTVGENLADWITARGGTITDLPALRTLITETARPTHVVPPDTPVDFPQYLPRAEFYAFRARVREVLRPEQFSLVDRLYRSTFHAIADTPPATPEDAAATLTALIAQHRTPGQALTIARAAQAALFTQGLLLKVSIDTLLHGTAAAEHRRMTPAEVRSLRAYRTAWRSTAAILYDANLSKDEIHAIRIDQVTPDGNLVGADHLPLHDDAKLYLRAQRTYRLLTGATGTDPLIDQTRQSVAVALRRLGAELNLPAPSNHVPTEARKSDRWQHNLGVALLPLVGVRLTGVPPAALKAEEAA